MIEKIRSNYGYTIVIVSFFIMLLALGFPSTFGILFKPISEEMGWTRTAISGAYSLFTLVGAIVGIIVGRLNDRFGPRMVVTACGLLLAAGYALIYKMEYIWQFYLYFGIMIGAGGTVGISLLSTVARWFTRRRSLMTGIVLTGSSCGMTVMPLLINHLLGTYGWRTACLAAGTAIVVVVVLGGQLLRRDPGKTGNTTYGESDETAPTPGTEERSLTFREALRNSQFWLYFVIFSVSGFYVVAIMVHFVPYVTDVGVSPDNAAAMLAVIGGVIMFGHITMGHLGDRIGYKWAFLIGTILTVLAVFVLIIAEELWTFYLFAVILGLAFGCCDAQESPLVAWSFGIESHGLFFGFSIFSFTVGGALGLVVLGYIFDRTGDYKVAFWLFAALSVIATILTLFLKSAVKKVRAPENATLLG